MPTSTQIIQFLNNHNYIGTANTVTARDLALHFQISDGHVEVEMRNDIRNTIASGSLIGSNNRGFYLINDLQDLEDNLNSLRNRAEETLVRRRNLLNTWNNAHPSNPTNLPDLNVS